MAFTDFATGAQALSQHVRQLIRCFNGDSGQGQPIALTGTSMPDNYPLWVKNLDDTNGFQLLIERSNGLDVLKVTKDGVRFSPDGSLEGLVPASLSGTETLTNKSFDQTSNVGLVHIETKTLSGAAASFDFTSIPAVYKDLQLRIHGRSSHSSDHQALQWRFNGDAGSNYDYLIWYVTGGGLTASDSFGSTAALCGIVAAANADANLFSTVIVDIQSYAQTTSNKLMQGRTAHKIGTGANELQNYNNSAAWRSTAAINQVTITPSNGNFITGSSASLYGIR